MSRVKLAFDPDDTQQVADALAQVLAVAAGAVHHIRIDTQVHHVVKRDGRPLHAMMHDVLDGYGNCRVVEMTPADAPSPF
jgi:non-ribosomal peptide synthetase component E (peptide arylation enzyme)